MAAATLKVRLDQKLEFHVNNPFSLIATVFRRYGKERLDGASAQSAHYGLLVLAPMLVLLVALAARLPLSGMLENLLKNTDEALPASAYRVISDQVQDIQRSTQPHLLLLAAGVFCYAGTRLFNTMVRGLNVAFEVEENRSWLHTHGLALLMTIGAFLLLLMAEILLLAGPHVQNWLVRPDTPTSITFLLSAGTRWTIICLAILLSTSLIYWLAPNVSWGWSLVTPGSVVALLGWILVSFGFQLYVDNLARYNETYGALAGVIVLMLWLHFIGMILFLGALVDCEVRKLRGQEP
jgi:membrane protein